LGIDIHSRALLNWAAATIAGVLIGVLVLLATRAPVLKTNVKKRSDSRKVQNAAPNLHPEQNGSTNSRSTLMTTPTNHTPAPPPPSPPPATPIITAPSLRKPTTALHKPSNHPPVKTKKKLGDHGSLVIVVGPGAPPVVKTSPYDLRFDTTLLRSLSAENLSGRLVLYFNLNKDSLYDGSYTEEFPVGLDGRDTWPKGLQSFLQGANWKRMDTRNFNRKVRLEIIFGSEPQ
jgi:hypothetical protein